MDYYTYDDDVIKSVHIGDIKITVIQLLTTLIQILFFLGLCVLHQGVLVFKQFLSLQSNLDPMKDNLDQLTLGNFRIFGGSNTFKFTNLNIYTGGELW